MRSVARYPEVREDGAMWVPLAPPPAPSYRQISAGDTGIIGNRAVLSYSTEWLMDLRVFSEPYEQRTDKPRTVLQLCDEGAWHDFVRHGITPAPSDCIVASVRLVFVVCDVATTTLFHPSSPVT